MSKHSLVVLLLFIVSASAWSMKLALPDETVSNGETVIVGIQVKNFVDIVSMQFSINWDASVIQYVGSEEGDLENVAIGDIQAPIGNLRLSWFDVVGQGENLEDDASIIYLKFLAIGQTGDFTDLSITSEPLEVQIFQDSLGSFKPVPPDFEQGSVSIIAPLSYSSEIQSVDCFGTNSGSINLAFAGNMEGLIYDWQGPGDFSADEKDIADLSPGEYQLVVQDSSGQALIEASFAISGPSAALSVDAINTQNAACGQNNGTASIAVVGGTPPYSFDWGNGNTTDSEIAGLPSGSYTLIITDANDCQINDNFTIDNPDIEAPNLGPEMSICAGEAFQLQAGEYAAYAWSTGSTQSSISVETTGDYSVTVSNNDDCIAADTVHIEVIPAIQLELSVDEDLVCPGIPVQLEANGGTTYSWIDTSRSLSETNIANPVANPRYTSVYQVISNNECSADTAEMTIEVFEVTANAGRDTCIAYGTAVELAASGGATYQWVEASRWPLSAYDIPNPTAEPEDSVTYTIVITDPNGCQKIDSVFVAVANDPLQFIKRINIITPNGDDKNDVLELENLTKYGVNVLYVYNRWGDIVYQKLNYQFDEERFDGTYKGKELPVGTYYYVIAFRTQELKQALTIVRE